MKQVVISVPNMQSTHCQTRLKNAVNEIGGVQIQHLEAGRLTASVSSDNTQNEVIQAIEKAGYSVSLEEGSSTSDCITG